MYEGAIALIHRFNPRITTIRTHHNSTYDAYGTLINSTGDTENQYRFAGEQSDEALETYYLRQRYYNPLNGRFDRKDSYEGNKSEPLTLHQYIYAHANPVGFIDPSGLSVLNFRRGGEINNLIGMNFIAEDPENREYDRYGSRRSSFLGAPDGSRQLTVKHIIQRALDDYSHPGFPGFNRLRPDLADFGTFDLYEIKSSNDLSRGLTELGFYLSVLNFVPGMPEHWYPGNDFVPPAIVLTSSGDIVWVHPPILGVVTYDIISDWRDAALATAVIASISAIDQLVSQVILASSLRFI